MAVYKHLVVYYFSGTGNSLNVAVWLCKAAHGLGIDSQMINIAKIDRKHITPPPDGAFIIFVSPIHGFNYPPIMMHFILRFPKGNNHLAMMNTRAGMLINKFITPGLTGIAFYLSALVLKFKGYSTKAFYPVDMPSNWVSLHPGLNDRTIKYLHEKNKSKVTAFAQKVLMGNRDFKAIAEFIQDIAVAPIALLYYFVGRFFLAKTFYASSACNNCNRCIDQCSVKAIIKIDNRPYWTFKCESCMKCMGECPKKAIETAHGFVLGYVVLFSIFMSFFYQSVNHLFSFQLVESVLYLPVKWGLMLLLMACTYRLVHFLMRFSFFQKLMVFTSLTSYKFWGKKYRALPPK